MDTIATILKGPWKGYKGLPSVNQPEPGKISLRITTRPTGHTISYNDPILNVTLPKDQVKLAVGA